MPLSHTPEVKYTESYSETSTNITTGVDLVYRYPSAKTVAQVKADVYEWCAANYRDFGRRPISSINISQDESSLGDIWTARVEWSTRPKNEAQKNDQYPQQPGCRQESFSSTGGTAHITTAFAEVGVAVYGGTAPSMGGGIAWDGDRFTGVDVVSPTFEFSLSYKYPYETITSTIRNGWLSLIGVVNADSFCDFAAGEVLYLGFSGSSSTEYDGELITIDGVEYQKAHNYYNITHNFRCSPNVTGMSIGGTTINKLGWEYVWVLRQKTDDSTTGQTIEVPVAVYKDQVYRYANFANIFE